ncbi:hypothetical protein M976_02054 [Buttiauxella ferragutiae ATCC 51602]|uniref:Alpha-galactosidase n=1 Tax=Buttiauxella ferragutiae ATCC 51602 TaxID=1354252 RepID=A0ABX2W8M3_9ENTR|nr:hypothetical protein [Buttiauxella ferragutiae]OAT27918.1 hypothetical protein M976_02054 [Buttiauxella ferragutiae ATCC 51602]
MINKIGFTLACLITFNAAHAAEFSQQGQQVTVRHGEYKLHYDLSRGTGDLLWGNVPVIKTFRSTAQLSQASLDSAKAVGRTALWQKVKDPARGEGETLTLNNRFADGSTLTVRFWFFNDKSWLLSDMQVSAQKNLHVTKLTPISASFADIGEGGDKRIYTTPYSNNFDFGVAAVNHFGLSQNGTDRFANPDEPMVKFNGVSHWVTALFDNTNHHGLVAGAASVQKWKSSQLLGEAQQANGALSEFALYNWGGTQSGKQVSSDLFFIGYFNDYRDGLESYGKAYNQGEPRLNWQGAVPVGFNAFYSHDSYGKARDMYDITDYVAKNLKPLGYEYINMDGGFQPDGYPEGMKTFTDYVHKKGLKAGGYLTPFAIYENWLDLPVDDTGYSHRDTCLHDEKGQLVKTYLGSYALDMSHPAAQYIVRRNIKNYLAWGYDYIKLDFLDMGLYEGKHHNPAVNGIQNYRIGMKIMRDEVLASGRPVFLNASIAPLLPAAFTHGRRAACDTSLGVANYSGIERQAFNSAASWWSNGTLYDYNDADMFLPEYIIQGNNRYGQLAAKRLATTVALGGGHWLVGDNLPFVDEDRSAWLENKALLKVAADGSAARPVSMNNFYHAGEHSPAMLVRKDDKGGVYVGLTNWQSKPQTLQLTPASLGLKAGSKWQITELYSGQSWQQKLGVVSYPLAGGATALLHFSKQSGVTIPVPDNLAQGKTITAGINSYELDLGKLTQFNQIVVKEPAPFAIRNYALAYQEGGAWHTLTRGFILGDKRTFSFPEMSARRLRVQFENHEGNLNAPEIEVYQHTTAVPAMHIVQESIAPGSERTDMQGEQQLMQTFTLQQPDLPKLDFWLFERYVDAVPGDNFRIQIVLLDSKDNPAQTLFSAALPPFNLPSSPAVYSLWPRLTGLDIHKRYALIFCSQGSTSQPTGKNSYSLWVSTNNPYANGELRHSVDNGKTWQTATNQDLLFALYSRAPFKSGVK